MASAVISMFSAVARGSKGYSFSAAALQWTLCAASFADSARAQKCIRSELMHVVTRCERFFGTCERLRVASVTGLYYWVRLVLTTVASPWDRFLLLCDFFPRSCIGQTTSVAVDNLRGVLRRQRGRSKVHQVRANARGNTVRARLLRAVARR